MQQGGDGARFKAEAREKKEKAILCRLYWDGFEVA
jgi:hypothetical protein